jgi:hypothetical protein
VLKRRSPCADDTNVFSARVRSTVLVAATCGFGASACTGHGTDGTTTDATHPPVETVRRTFTATELDVGVDENGRPYDAAYAQYWAADVEREEVTTLVVPDGRLRVMDGSALQVDPAFFADEAAEVDFDTDQLESSIVWEVFDEREARSVFALIVSVPGTEVDRWEPFEYADGTDGGVGGVTSQSVIDIAAEASVSDDLFISDAEFDANSQVNVYDMDGITGDDAVIFSNGYADGGFPMTRGLDADGRLVSVAIVDTRYPWRLAIPEGTPPADITAREDELAECLAGKRSVEVLGDSLWCPSDS